MRHAAQSAEVVRYWQAVEIFSPQAVPKPTDSGPPYILDIPPDGVLPWDPAHPLVQRPLRPGLRWQFAVYGGLYELKEVRKALLKVYGEDDGYVDARQGGQTAMFAFSVDDGGRIIEKSATLSACAWAIGRVLQDDADSLSDFGDEQNEFAGELNRLSVPRIPTPSNGRPAGTVTAAAADAAIAGASAAAKALVQGAVTPIAGGTAAGIAATVAGTFVERVLKRPKPSTPPATGTLAGPQPAAATPNGPPIPPITITALFMFVRELAQQLGIADELRPTGIRIKCVQVGAKRAGEPVEQDFLNSFIVGDLSNVADALSRGDVGAGLARYLTPNESIDTAARVDVRQDPRAVIEKVSPANIPAGRWPAGLGKPLALSQQFAVNHIMAQLHGDAGIFAVNGPPGTGKTTMLRDMIAALLVERSRRLADLKRPSDAFTKRQPRVKSSGYVPEVWQVAEPLTGFEVVVASKNNGAVANVTTEIPGVKAIDDWAEGARQVDYFARLASHVLGREAWGLVAAQLGNMENRSAFADRFWWSTDPEKPRPEGKQQQRPTHEDRWRSGIPAFGMQDLLEDAEKQPPALDWAATVRDFRSALDAVETLRRERQAAASAFSAIEEHVAKQQAAGEAAAAADSELVRIRELWTTAQNSTLSRAVGQYRTVSDRLDDHQRRRPGFWVSVSTLGRAARDWHQEYGRLQRDLQAAGRHADDVHRAIADLEAKLLGADENARRRRLELAQADQLVAAAQAKIDHARMAWPGRIPVDHLADDEQLQLCGPWADEAYTAARSRLFFQAMRLHKTFALLAAPRLRGNLSAASSILKGDGAAFSGETRLAAWQSLFLLVPVISTTFASLPRLFAGLGGESLGWLFIDEAGQAAPQEAVGGIWRARRTVVVGDPLQLEPIVTLPFTAQQALRKAYGVSEEWVPEGTSVQGIADRVTPFGTYLSQGGDHESVWVGAPLRVHRRCERPMFEISNQIAYGGDLMVYGTAPRGPFYGENNWIGVTSGTARGNWIPAEGEALAQLIRRLLTNGIDRTDIRVISPFRDAVRGCKEVCERVAGSVFAKHNVGTVHTVQGKEAEVVILVLGGNPDSHGARRWASQRPNLLNVAVSRARRRLYVIGNHKLWGAQPYFTTLAASVQYADDVG